MRKIVIILSVLALIASSCGQTNSKAAKQASEQTAIQTTEQNKTAEPVLTIKKLSENQYLLPEGDTLSLEDKPFFKLFEGSMEGRKVQAYVTFLPFMEDLTYYMTARIHIEGYDEYEVFVLHKTREGAWIETLDRYNHFNKIYFKEPNTFRLSAEGTQYVYDLKESDIKFQAYNRFDYRMNYCESEGNIFYRPHWQYEFAALPAEYPDRYATLFNSKPFEKIEYFNPNQEWKQNVDLEIKEGNNEDGDDCYTTFSQNYYKPFYIDSAIFVISSFGHVYMGGAHGMFGEKYYNFDVKTGNLIDIRDIVDIDNPDFIDFYTKRLTDKYKNEDGEVPFSQNPVQVSENFYLLPTGITFQYNPYELMGFAAGMPDLFLSYGELEPFLK